MCWNLNLLLFIFWIFWRILLLWKMFYIFFFQLIHTYSQYCSTMNRIFEKFYVLFKDIHFIWNENSKILIKVLIGLLCSLNLQYYYNKCSILIVVEIQSYSFLKYVVVLRIIYIILIISDWKFECSILLFENI